MDKSRFPNFYRLSIKDRVEAVYERGLISEEDYLALKNQQQQLDLNSADKMIENVIGVMGHPNRPWIELFNQWKRLCDPTGC